jgi:hypothetical protein
VAAGTGTMAATAATFADSASAVPWPMVIS